MRLILTHNDLDGVGSALMLLQKDKDIKTKVEFLDYETIDQRILEVIRKLPIFPDISVYITDICPLEKTCEKIDEINSDGAGITLFDHHITRSWVQKYRWAHFDPKVSATMLLFNTLFDGKLCFEKDFALAVNAYDMWQITSGYRHRGEELAALLQLLGQEKFLSVFSKNINADTNSPWQEIISTLLDNRQLAVNEARLRLPRLPRHMDNRGQIYAIIFVPEYISEIGSNLLRDSEGEDLKYIVLVNPISNTCSLRARNKEIDVGEIAKRFHGGGHAAASGFPFQMLQGLEDQIVALLNKL